MHDCVQTGSMFEIDKGPAIADELPYLGGMEVIEEVFALISRLESDRQQAERDLLQEKQRARFLQRKTDELVRKRAREFPSAVQAGNFTFGVQDRVIIIFCLIIENMLRK